jgi:hypothetical protein
MDQERKKSGWRIWVYLSPVYVLLAMSLMKWTEKVNSSDVDLSKDEYGAFNAAEGEVKIHKTEDNYTPDLTDSGYSVRYRIGKARPGARPKAKEESPQRALTVDEEYMGMGSREGFLTYAVGKIMDRPKEVWELFNNPMVVKGFMSRGTVQAALAGPQELQNYFKDTAAVNSFLGNSVVQTAITKPEIVRAFAASGMAKAILASPGVQGLIKNPEALTELAESNPQLMQFISNPNVRNALKSNPQTAGPAAGLGGG